MTVDGIYRGAEREVSTRNAIDQLKWLGTNSKYRKRTGKWNRLFLSVWKLSLACIWVKGFPR